MAIAFIGQFWDPSYFSNVSHAVAQPSDTWKVTLGEEAEKEGLHALLERANFNYQIDLNYTSPSPYKSLDVLRNHSILLEANDCKPSVSNIHRAIIVQL